MKPTTSPQPYAVVEFHLRQVMDERKLTVTDVSNRTGISRNGLYMLLDRLPRAIRFDTIARLCVGLDIHPADLFVVRHPRAR
jgi:DNA-binding Xre family transcriptional regulator